MCNWSVASPLERELIPADAGAELAVSEVAKKQFQSWRLMRQLVLQHLGREHAQAAKLVNRYRRRKQLQVGDTVLVADPKLTKERAGRAPWKRPLGNFGRITEVTYNKANIRGADGTLLRDVHHDWIVSDPSGG